MHRKALKKHLSYKPREKQYVKQKDIVCTFQIPLQMTALMHIKVILAYVCIRGSAYVCASVCISSSRVCVFSAPVSVSSSPGLRRSV